MVARMRLRELAQAIGEVLAIVEGVRAAGIKIATGENGLAVSQVGGLLATLDRAMALPLGAPTLGVIGALRKHSIVSAGREGVHASQTEWSSFESQRQAVVAALRTALAVVDAVVPVSAPGLFAIKLPEQQSGFDALAEDVKALSTVFEQPLRRTLNEGLTVVGVDRGSAWIEFQVRTIEALEFLLALYGAIVAFRKKRGEDRRNAAEADTAIERARAEVRQAEAEADGAEARRRRDEAEARVAEIEAQMKAWAAVEELRRQQWLADQAANVVKPYRDREDLRIQVTPEAENAVRIAIVRGAELGDRGMTLMRSLPPGGMEEQPLPSLAAGHQLAELPSGPKGES